MRGRLLTILLAASAAAWSADRGFDQMVKGIEAHYGTRRMHIPLVGLASFVAKVGQPGGASGFKLAVFQNLDSCGEYGDGADLDRLMDRLGTGSLQPLIRVRSRRDGESTYIFAGEAGKSTSMLIARFQRREATVMEVKVNKDTLLETIANPATAGKTFGVRDPWWDR